ncbi:L-rhamnose/proton symporter RhaT [Flammeovirga kamogawensis]|uniref:Rhamnose/proton symporter RhaT n=1 Tax=Flammeovirga kamogawensis TaxID=373891 RepID=A0ABX8H4B4_9BACT|nr:L-rhamnose/proton symporter RhaT [Flammeovirga kamogawensis]MBB6461954.1 L-rhamnose-H+ transport protein [Flammeovirga kamogawensis]QWG10439.1 rhamnose/proton symporter RhaT [Flammeovirga kamogawensis]TRX63949.1 rhamnose/proton symporter RhaT [Flammeovirga kamogawensis]
MNLLAITLIVFASFFQGTFGLGMKHIAPLKWENWWLVHSFIAMIAFPIIWSLIVVPETFEIIAGTDTSVLMMAMIYGFLWGIGGILFGISVEYTGISITYGIVMGLAASVGSLIPLFQMEQLPSNINMVLAGVALLLVGVGITAIAGVKRDTVQNGEEEANDFDTLEDDADVLTLAEPKVAAPKKSIKVGVAIATACGVLSAALNVGFSNAAPVAASAVANYGADPKDASLVAWVVVLIGAFIMNGGYALFKLVQNNSWASFKVANSGNAYKWSILAGLFWFAALGVYGQGAALMGSLGPVIGWPILLGLALIISNVWGYRSGEWKGAKQPFNILLGGLAVLIVAVCILGYANY